MTVADFVIVEYEGQYFPGVIIKTRKFEYEVRAMHKIGPQNWKWPEQVDQKPRKLSHQCYCVLEETHTLFLKSPVLSMRNEM